MQSLTGEAYILNWLNEFPLELIFFAIEMII